MNYFCGIDFGNKLAGTTVICTCCVETYEISLQTSEKKQDADIFLQKNLFLIRPLLVFLDAPLSLPSVYKKDVISQSEDFFFRQGDKLLKAMSPMFLGGLTARAMRLRAEMQPMAFYETYPAAQARRLGLQVLGYKQKPADLERVMNEIQNTYAQLKFPPGIQNWHEVDAILATIAAYRFLRQEHEVFGDASEGCIYV